MAGEKFKLKFADGIEVETREFDGWDDAVFTLKQHDDGHGRDDFFGSDGEGKAGNVVYSPDMEKTAPFFKKLLREDDVNGFEAVVKQVISDDDSEMELEVDFAGATSNQIDSFRTSLIQNTELQIYKRRMQTKINGFSNRTLDSEPIEPLTTQRLLFNAYPYVQVSKWKQGAPINHFAGGSFYASYFQGIEEFGIDDTLTPFGYTSGLGDVETAVNMFKYVRSANNLEQVKIKVNCDIDFHYNVTGGSGSTSARISLICAVFTEPYDIFQAGSIRFEVYSKQITGNTDQVFHLPEEFIFDVPSVSRGQCISVFWGFDWDSPQHTAEPKTRWEFKSTSMEITATSLAYNTIIRAIRLIDVMRYAVKSASGLDIVAPRFDVGGEFYELMASSGNLMRLKIDEPFYITNEDVLKILRQFKADYELTPDEIVYFGLFEDFYQDIEIAYFDANRQDVSFELAKNPKFMCNRAKMKFNSFEAQRENTQPNTYDEVHGEAEWSFANRSVENVHEVEIGWTMSARSIEEARRAAIEKASDTATNRDTNLFGLDTTTAPLQNTNALTFTERDELQHFYDEEANQLHLRNQGNFSWLQLGMTANDPNSLLVINTNPAQPNQGSYLINEVSNGEVILTPIGANPSTNNDGIRFTTFTYLIDVNNIDAVVRVGGNATGIANADRYPNLNYTLGQSRKKWHDRYLATMNHYRRGSKLRTAFYQNNPNAVISGQREGGVISEDYPDGGITLPEPILTPVLYKNISFSGNDIRLKTFIELSKKARSVRGFVSFVDNRGHLHKFYIKSMSWQNAGDLLLFEEGEQKYEPSEINIYRDSQGVVHIGNSYQDTAIRFEAVGEEEYAIKDQNGRLLYNPFFWHRISINGNLAGSKNQLIEWVSNL